MKRVVPTQFPSDPLVSDAESFGTTIRAARTKAGMSLADAAMNVGVSRQTLFELETGQASVGLPIAPKVAREFGVAVLAVQPAERDLIRRAIADLRSSADHTPGPALPVSRRDKQEEQR